MNRHPLVGSALVCIVCSGLWACDQPEPDASSEASVPDTVDEAGEGLPSGIDSDGERPVPREFAITEVAAEVADDASVTIRWRTDVAADSSVGFGLATLDEHSVHSDTLTREHALVIGPLPDGLYRFRVQSTSADGRTAVDENSGLNQFHIQTFPRFVDVDVRVDMAGAVRATWQTDVPTAGFIELGRPGGAFDLLLQETEGFGTNHSVALAPPAFDMDFAVRLMAVDADGDIAYADHEGAGYLVRVPAPVDGPDPGPDEPSEAIIDIGTLPASGALQYLDSRDTSASQRDAIDAYPPFTQNESGPEFVYRFVVPSGETWSVRAVLSAMPSAVDVDIHLLASLEPLVVLSRGHFSVDARLSAGTYYLVADTWVNSQGVELAGPYTLTVDFARAADEPAVVQGYLAYWSRGTSNIRWDYLTHLIYFCVDPNNDGTVASLHGYDTTRAIDASLAAGTTTLLSVCQFGASDIAALVNDPEHRATLIDTLEELVRMRSIHGVDLDFEAPGADAREGFTALVHELRARLDSMGPAPDGKPYRLHVALMPVDWSDGYDLAAFVDEIDYAMVMSYAGHTADSPQAGPTNKLYSPRPPWSHPFSYQYFFERWLSEMGHSNAHKLLAGVGYYLRDFVVEDFEIPSTSMGSSRTKLRTYADVLRLLSEPSMEHEEERSGYFESLENPYYFYREGDERHQLWHDDHRSLMAKYAYVKTLHMGGVGIWALNYDDGVDDTWDALRDAWF